jgi:hypothetical protein
MAFSTPHTLYTGECNGPSGLSLVSGYQRCRAKTCGMHQAQCILLDNVLVQVYFVWDYCIVTHQCNLGMHYE